MSRSMPPRLTSEVEARAYRLLSNKTALNVLNALHEAEAVDRAIVDADPQAVADALVLLDELGLVHQCGAAELSDRPVSLTPRGRSLARLL